MEAVMPDSPPARRPKIRRIVRSISLTQADLRAIEEITTRINYRTEARMLNQSEVLRAGLVALLRLPAKELALVAESVPRLMPGPEKT